MLIATHKRGDQLIVVIGADHLVATVKTIGSDMVTTMSLA
jgi:hypothetical protein